MGEGFNSLAPVGIPVPSGLTAAQEADFIATIRRHALRAKMPPAQILKGGRHRRFLMWRRAAQCDLVDAGHSFRAVARMFETDHVTIRNNVERERALRRAGKDSVSAHGSLAALNASAGAGCSPGGQSPLPPSAETGSASAGAGNSGQADAARGTAAGTAAASPRTSGIARQESPTP